MVMVGVDYGSLYRRTHSLSRLAWFWIGGRLAPFYIHQMNRVNSRNGSAMMTDTINIVLDIIIVIIIIIIITMNEVTIAHRIFWKTPHVKCFQYFHTSRQNIPRLNHSEHSPLNDSLIYWANTTLHTGINRRKVFTSSVCQTASTEISNAEQFRTNNIAINEHMQLL